MNRIVVTGAGGFIGHHLVTCLKESGHWVRGVDLKPPEFEPSPADQFELLDLRRWDDCLLATRGADEVYALAADMGGMGFISSNHGTIMRNNSLIDVHTIEAARVEGVQRIFYSSSACIYPDERQLSADVVPLKENDAYPADPQDAYGWEKLMAERFCSYVSDEYGVSIRVARFHNIYGPLGTYRGGREKAPAALCRKVAEASPGGIVEVWGDGAQTRSFCYIEDAVEGVVRIMRSDFSGPVNLGTEELVTVDELANLAIEVSGKADLRLVHVPGPQGVRGRNSDNTLLRQVLGWEPTTPLVEGLASTYRWVEKQVNGS